MELTQYITIVRKWLWLIILAAMVGGTYQFIGVYTAPDRYAATALISIGGFIDAPNPRGSDIAVSIDLTETYAQLVRTNDVLQATIDALDLSTGTGTLNSLLSTSIIPKTAILSLTITSSDPILSADVVNELVHQVIIQSPTTPSQEDLRTITRITEQIEALSEEVNNLRDQLSALDLQLLDPNIRSAERLDLQSQRGLLVNQINNTTGNVVEFTNIVTLYRQQSNSVRILEEARIPTSPVGRSATSAGLLGAAMAGAFVFAIVLLYEYFNSTKFFAPEDLSRILGQPVLGYVSQYGSRYEKDIDKTLLKKVPPRIIDEYRIIRTNLLFASELSNGVYVVTSAAPDEGKSTFSSNLAISLATSGLRVLLIDADLRKPRIHKMFELENSVGLTSLLTSSLTQHAKVNASDDNEASTSSTQPLVWENAIQQVAGTDHLYVLCSGQTVMNPTELLGSTIMKDWVDNIKNALNFDIVLIDTPPLLAFPDSSVMAISLNAKVISVVRANHTRYDPAKRTIESLLKVKADVVGVVLNQADPRHAAYQNYKYYKEYYPEM